MKKRVVWNLGADMNDLKPRQDNGNETEHRPHSSSENGFYSHLIFLYMIVGYFYL